MGDTITIEQLRIAINHSIGVYVKIAGVHPFLAVNKKEALRWLRAERKNHTDFFVEIRSTNFITLGVSENTSGKLKVVL